MHLVPPKLSEACDLQMTSNRLGVCSEPHICGSNKRMAAMWGAPMPALAHREVTDRPPSRKDWTPCGRAREGTSRRVGGGDRLVCRHRRREIRDRVRKNLSIGRTLYAAPKVGCTTPLAEGFSSSVIIFAFHRLHPSAIRLRLIATDNLRSVECATHFASKSVVSEIKRRAG